MIPQKNKLFWSTLSMALSSYALLSAAHSSTAACPAQLTKKQIEPFIVGSTNEGSIGEMSCITTGLSIALVDNFDKYAATSFFQLTSNQPPKFNTPIKGQVSFECNYKGDRTDPSSAGYTADHFIYFRCTRPMTDQEKSDAFPSLKELAIKNIQQARNATSNPPAQFTDENLRKTLPHDLHGPVGLSEPTHTSEPSHDMHNVD